MRPQFGTKLRTVSLYTFNNSISTISKSEILCVRQRTFSMPPFPIISPPQGFTWVVLDLNCLAGAINLHQPIYLLSSQGWGLKLSTWILKGMHDLRGEVWGWDWWSNVPENSPGDRFWLDVIITWCPGPELYLKFSQGRASGNFHGL